MANKHFLLTLRIRTGELEFTSKSVHALSARRSPDVFAEKYAAGFYGDGLSEEQDGEHLFNNGSIAVSVRSIQRVSAEEASVLRRYL